MVTDLLAGHNTLRIHRYIGRRGLIDSPFCREFWAEEETSAYLLCEREALITLIHHYPGSIFFFFTQKSQGANWNFIKEQGSITQNLV